jgi:hypothetical protein
MAVYGLLQSLKPGELWLGDIEDVIAPTSDVAISDLPMNGMAIRQPMNSYVHLVE